MAVSILPNLAGTLSLLLVPDKFKVVRLLAYYCTGISNAAFVLGQSTRLLIVRPPDKRATDSRQVLIGRLVAPRWECFRTVKEAGDDGLARARYVRCVKTHSRHRHSFYIALRLSCLDSR